MPQATQITVVDRDTSNLVFDPQSEVDNVHTFVLPNANGIPAGEAKLSVSLRTSGKNRKVRIKIVKPVVATETVNGVQNPIVVRYNMADLVFTFSGVSTLDEREEIMDIIHGLTAASESTMNDVIAGLKSIY